MIALPLAERQAHIMSLLRAHPKGLRMRDIAKALRLGPDRTGEVLRSLRKLGLAVASTNGGAAVIWTTPERVAAVRRLIRDRRRARAVEREKRRLRVAEQERQADEWLRIDQRHIPAGKAAPISITGPISVFQALRNNLLNRT